VPNPKEEIRALKLALEKESRLLAGGISGKIYIYRISEKTVRLEKQLEGHTTRVSTILFPSGSPFFITSSWDCTIKFWNIDYSNRHITLEAPIIYRAAILAMAIDPSGTKLVTTEDDGKIKIWSFYGSSHWELTKVIEADGSRMSDVGITSDGLQFVTAGFDRKLRFWSM